MRVYKVILRDGREEYIRAQRYRREGDQYVFERDGDDEVQFFQGDDVIGISVVPKGPWETEGPMFSAS